MGIPPRRRYQGFFADSSRWERFSLRPGDVVITTPSKCGTTWMQHIVGMLLLDRTDLGVPIAQISPWLDMVTRTEADVFALLEAQRHRRFVKTHTPLDGLPLDDDVTYLAVIRHPLDVALSDRDHRSNTDLARARELRLATTGELPAPQPGRDAEPEDLTDYLRWFVDNDLEPTGSGPYGLADYCHQVRTYWDARTRANVHLFHYADLWDDREAEMRRVAGALDVEVPEDRWPELVDAAGLETMRRASQRTAPEADRGLWRDPARFFRQGGTRQWADLLDPPDLAHLEERLAELAGGATDWILHGRRALTRGDPHMSDARPEVLFVCVHNAGRSQMAAALLAHHGGDRVVVRSAGSAPADDINPAVVEAMAEVGIDLLATGARPKQLDEAAVQASDVVITMGCGDACPIYPGKRYEDWDLDDPAGQDVDAVRPIRDEIHRRVGALLASLDPTRG